MNDSLHVQGTLLGKVAKKGLRRAQHFFSAKSRPQSSAGDSGGSSSQWLPLNSGIPFPWTLSQTSAHESTSETLISSGRDGQGRGRAISKLSK